MTSPQPNWKPGTKITPPFSSLTEVDIRELPQKERYKFLIGAIVPRPIAFVSTVSASGVVNVAPFSFFSGVSSNPPSVVFSVGTPPDGRQKDTLRNIKETKEFVINSANEWMIEAVVHCAGDFAEDIDEMKEAGLTPLPSQKISPPRVAESAMQME
ncbi:MAG: flavin reductase family protein, partial [Bdellovibrionales bacterium]|nr:flavin reductase family protein [Bdellovibrionales bacterium]